MLLFFAGQLIKLVFGDPHFDFACAVLKVKGMVVYPYDTEQLLDHIQATVTNVSSTNPTTITTTGMRVNATTTMTTTSTISENSSDSQRQMNDVATKVMSSTEIKSEYPEPTERAVRRTTRASAVPLTTATAKPRTPIKIGTSSQSTTLSSVEMLEGTTGKPATTTRDINTKARSVISSSTTEQTNIMSSKTTKPTSRSTMQTTAKPSTNTIKVIRDKHDTILGTSESCWNEMWGRSDGERSVLR